jgi:hypothetical protein
VSLAKIRLTQKGWEGYTGDFGGQQFVDGVSVEQLPRNIVDRLSANVNCVTIDAEGEETPAGIARRIIGGQTIPVTSLEPLKRQSAKEKDDELKNDRMTTKAKSQVQFYTANELEALAARSGIHGLREVAKPWGCKDRSINKLIKAILEAQETYKLRQAELEAERAKARKDAEDQSLAKQAQAAAELDAAAKLTKEGQAEKDAAEQKAFDELYAEAEAELKAFNEAVAMKASAEDKADAATDPVNGQEG